MKTHDALVIGAGPNGLVAANVLADAGWDVLVLEAEGTIGGAVRSARDVDPDFIHDTFSAFYPLGAASPAMTALDLESYGLVWEHAPAVLGNPRPDAPWALLHRDVEVTASLFDESHAGDGDAWYAMVRQWEQAGPALLECLMSPFPPVRGGVKMLTALRRVGGLEYVRMLLEPARSIGATRFGGEAPSLLLTGNAAHADIPLDATGSGLMGLLMTMLGQTVGFPVPRGGAGNFSAALARRFTCNGGEIRCEAEVAHVIVEHGRAVGVELVGGERVRCRRAVVADVAAPILYGLLLDDADLPPRVLRAMSRFILDPGTVKVDWAMDRPIPWATAPSHAPGTVHVADSVDQVVESLNQVSARQIPAEPFLLAGQMTTADQTRSPAGTESFWAYTHVPQSPSGDSGNGSIRGTWDRDDSERFADRMQDRVERYAPGFTSCIRARRVLSPPDLEARDRNLLGGAINGGTAGLYQQVVFRPVPGLGRAGTAIDGLFLGSASAHPGGGVHGAPGANAARAALFRDRLRSPLGR